MAYVLGFMFADGSLLNTNQSSRTYYLAFFNNDLGLLKQIRSCLQSNHKIYARLPRLRRFRDKEYLSKTNYVLRIGNKVMYQDLIWLGLTHRKSLDMHLPQVPQRYFSYFLRGYFDGDGCINLSLPEGRNTHRLLVLFTSGSVYFLSELGEYISNLLDVVKPKFHQSTGAYNLSISGSTALRLLEYIYKDLQGSPYLHRKYKKYLEYRDNLIGPRVRKALLNS